VARVLVTRHLPDGGLDPLIAAGHELVERPDDTPYPPDELAALAGDVDAIVCILTDRIDAAVLRAGVPRLRVVANVAVGYDNIDVAAAHELGVAVCNTPGVLDETTADLAFLLMLAAARRASDAEADLRAGRWTGFHIGDFLGVDVHGATLGLVGLGRIGRAVARRAAGFGMEVLHHTRTDTGMAGWIAQLDELLPRCDFVSLHVPLHDGTRGLIDARRLALMKRSAVLVNTARGPVVDEEALAVALEDGTIFAAGIDVYEREPDVHPRLLAAPHAVLLPHIGSATGATRRRMAQLASEGAVAVLRGELRDAGEQAGHHHHDRGGEDDHPRPPGELARHLVAPRLRPGPAEEQHGDREHSDAAQRELPPEAVRRSRVAVAQDAGQHPGQHEHECEREQRTADRHEPDDRDGDDDRSGEELAL
jgi:glyoxylate reductase